MTKRQINAIIKKLQGHHGKLLPLAAEFGEVDNYLMQRIDDVRDLITTVIGEIRDAESDLIEVS